MSWQTMADRALQNVVAAFKTAATYSPASGTPYALNGVYSSPARGVDPESGAEISSSHPTFGVRIGDLRALPAPGDQLTIGSTVYRILDDEEDGEGGTLLTLQRTG